MTTTDNPPSMRVTNIALDYNEMPREVALIASAPVAERINEAYIDAAPGCYIVADEPVIVRVATAARIARHFGRVTPVDKVTHEIYNCLTGVVFNRFWYDGLDDYDREAGR